MMMMIRCQAELDGAVQSQDVVIPWVRSAPPDGPTVIALFWSFLTG